MRKGIVGRIGLITALFTTVCSFGVCSAATVDYKAGVEVSVEHNQYVSGDVFTAEVKMTGLADEKAAGVGIGAFETRINFDGTKLDVSDCSFNEALGLEASDTQNFKVTTDNPNVVVACFDRVKGVSLNDIGEDGKLTIGEITFKAKALGDVSFTFDRSNQAATNVFTIGKDAKEYTFDIYAEANINIVKNLLEKGSAVYDASAKTVKPIGLRIGSDKAGAVFIAKLFDKSSGLNRSVKVVTDLSKADEVVFENIETKDNLEVRYYLWDGFFTMRALTPYQTVEIN